MVLPEEPPLDWLPGEPLELPELPVPPTPDWLPDEPVPLWLVALLPPELPVPLVLLPLCPPPCWVRGWPRCPPAECEGRAGDERGGG